MSQEKPVAYCDCKSFTKKGELNNPKVTTSSDGETCDHCGYYAVMIRPSDFATWYGTDHNRYNPKSKTNTDFDGSPACN